MYDCAEEIERLRGWISDLKSGRETHFRRGPDGRFSTNWTEELAREIEEELATLLRY